VQQPHRVSAVVERASDVDECESACRRTGNASGEPHALQRDSVVVDEKNTLTGLVEAHSMSEFQFNANFEADRSRVVPGSSSIAAGAARETVARGDVASSWWGSWAPPDDADDAPPGEAVGLGADAVPLSDADAAAIDARNDARKKARVADAKAKSAAATG
jgi:hypothetical protein